MNSLPSKIIAMNKLRKINVTMRRNEMKKKRATGVPHPLVSPPFA
jgi:hypothetical protein